MAEKIPEKKLRVLESASKLFSVNSFHDVKLDQVAADAKVAKGTIYTYFKSKDELFCQCILHDACNFEKIAQEVISAGIKFEDKFRKLVEIQARFYNEKGDLVKQLFHLGPTLKISKAEFESFMSKLKEGVQHLSFFFQMGINEGVLGTELSATQMAILFHQIFDINMLFEMFNEPQINPEDTYNFLMKILKK
jgi:AcrR family transcriptional regulator